MTNKLDHDKDFKPCSVDIGDELFPNGIFVFNITKLLDYIQNNPNKFSIEKIEINKLSSYFSNINEIHLKSVDISRPVILAEISPSPKTSEYFSRAA